MTNLSAKMSSSDNGIKENRVSLQKKITIVLYEGLKKRGLILKYNL